MLHLLLENLRLSVWPSQDTDGESEVVEPQSRTRNISTLLQSKENPQNHKGKKTKKEVEKPILMTKTVSVAMSTVHEVRTLEGHCSTQISVS